MERKLILAIVAVIVAAIIIMSTAHLVYKTPKNHALYPIKQVIYQNTTYNWTDSNFFVPHQNGTVIPNLQEIDASASIYGTDGNLSTAGFKLTGNENYINGTSLYEFIFNMVAFGNLIPRLQATNVSVFLSSSLSPSPSSGSSYILSWMGGTNSWSNTSFAVLHYPLTTLSLLNDTANSTGLYHFSFLNNMDITFANLRQNETYIFSIEMLLNGLQKNVS